MIVHLLGVLFAAIALVGALVQFGQRRNAPRFAGIGLLVSLIDAGLNIAGRETWWAFAALLCATCYASVLVDAILKRRDRGAE